MYDYAEGKLDWLAAGLPSEGREASQPSASDVARSDVPTCSLDDTIGEIKARVGTSTIDVCVVVNAANVVLGLLRVEELAGADDTRAEDAMQPGPSTFRPHVPIGEMARYLDEHEMDSAPITTSEGKLMGALFVKDAQKVADENR
ncbi:MAG: CBS domain-containing protein [Actinomycetota bacterium]